MSRVSLAAFVLLAGASFARAQDLVLFIHTPVSTVDGSSFSGNYSFPDTAVGGSSSATFRLKNTSATNSYLVLSINFSPGSAFAVQGTYILDCLAPAGIVN